MKVINIIILVVLLTVIVIAVVYHAKLSTANTKLETANKQLEETRILLERSKMECTILREDSRRANNATEQYTHAIESKQTEYVEKYRTIHNDETAADWLSTPLPNSIRLLYGCSCDGN